MGCTLKMKIYVITIIDILSIIQKLLRNAGITN